MPARSARDVPHPAALLRPLLLLWALAVLAACAAGGGAAAAGPYPRFRQYEGRDIRKVSLNGQLKLPRDTVLAVVSTRPSRCRLLAVLPVCLGKRGKQSHKLDLEVLSRDVVRIQLLYRDHGYYGTRVVPTVEEAPGNKVDVRFAVMPGDLVMLRTFEITGAERVVPTEELLKRSPLKAGEPFRRAEFLASVDTVRNAVLDKGHAYAQVLRNYSIDTIADVADVRLEVSPGPLVTVDTIIFEGMDRLTERTARRQLSFSEGKPLKARELVRSQRNLYDLELVNYATVEVAPESLQVTPDSTQLDQDSIGSTVLVRITEAARYAAEVSAGYGTVDCFRGSASNTDRNFLGGARRLQLSGSVAKVGIAGPLDAGLDRSFLCKAFRLDSTSTDVDTAIAHAMNYRLAADFLQPRLFGTHTSVGAGAYMEQTSELGLYLRRARGGQIGVIREISPATLLSTTYTVERGSTTASDFFFCVAYEVCRRTDIDTLRAPRWSNFLGAGVVRNRVRQNPFPTAGYQARVGTDYASRLIGSDDNYLRLLADGSMYRQVKKGYVVQLRLFGGTFFEGLLSNETGFIPPQKRFYAGGPTTVRGFRRNELGPTVYVARPRTVKGDSVVYDTVSSATGGTRTVLGTVELTTPSPFLSQTLRLAVFVDGGQVWAPADTLLPRPGLRFTPGAGVRAATPVGPIRFDVAFNPYPREHGPLFVIDPAGHISEFPVKRDFAPPPPSFFKRLVLNISIGQTF